jgi:hypothetical protein
MSWERTPPPINEGEDELQLKLEYARLVARNERERFTAGYKLFPGAENYGRALQAQAWFYDPFVQDEIARLRDGEDEDAKPSVDSVKGEVLQLARSAMDKKDAIAAYKLYLEAEGAIQKGTNVNIDNSDRRVVNVLKVPTRDITAEDDADFDRRFLAQQTQLIANARSERPIAA